MVEGIAMLTVLAGMGVYFIKSTDLPKDMKQRSEHLQTEARHNTTVVQKKFDFPTNKVKASVNINHELNKLNEAKILETKKLERLMAIELQNKQIDKLTLAITTLEQELKVNNARNTEILAEIEGHLEALRILNENKLS